MGKFDCPVCGKTANKCESNKAGSVACNLCELWYHPPCAKVDPAMVKLITDCIELNGISSPWSFGVCMSAGSRQGCRRWQEKHREDWQRGY